MTPTNIDQLTDFGVWVLDNQPELFDQYLTRKITEQPKTEPQPVKEDLPQYHKPKFKPCTQS